MVSRRGKKTRYVKEEGPSKYPRLLVRIPRGLCSRTVGADIPEVDGHLLRPKSTVYSA